MTSIKVKFRPSTIPSKEGVVYFQVICDRKVKLLTSQYRVFREEWDNNTCKINVPAADAARQSKLIAIQAGIDHETALLQRAVGYLQTNGEDVLEKLPEYYGSHALTGYVFPFMEYIIRGLKQQGRPKTASTYTNALRSFSKFLSERDIHFNQLDAHLIRRYETELKVNGLMPNTISFYMRILRAVYNKAAERGLTVQCHPFRHVYTGIDKTVKRAVDEQTIRKLHRLALTAPGLLFARDMFMFSIYARGMAFIDMANLKKTDMHGEYLSYERHKTGQRLNIKIEPCLERIITHYALRTAGSDYLLPILPEATSYDSALRVQNSRLQTLSRILGQDRALSTYVARHSWASLAKRNGVSLQVISESMGHDNENTTRIYLASLDRSVIDDANAMILSRI